MVFSLVGQCVIPACFWVLREVSFLRYRVGSGCEERGPVGLLELLSAQPSAAKKTKADLLTGDVFPAFTVMPVN